MTSSIVDRVINRGVVGKWHNGGTRTLSGVMYIVIMVALAWLFIHGWRNGLEVGGVGILLLMAILALGDANLEYVLAWILDDEEVARPL